MMQLNHDSTISGIRIDSKEAFVRGLLSQPDGKPYKVLPGETRILVDDYNEVTQYTDIDGQRYKWSNLSKHYVHFTYFDPHDRN